jgi:hypothetical protein
MSNNIGTWLNYDKASAELLAVDSETRSKIQLFMERVTGKRVPIRRPMDGEVWRVMNRWDVLLLPYGQGVCVGSTKPGDPWIGKPVSWSSTELYELLQEKSARRISVNLETYDGE